MAISQITYTAFANQDDRLSIRNKINNLGASVADLSVEVEADLSALDGRVTQNEIDITELQADVLPLSILSVGTTNPLSPQSLTAGVSEKLYWMTAATLSNGSAISHNIPQQEITINTAGVYKIYGTITLDLPNNVEAQIELYVNDAPTGMKNIVSGLSNFSNTVPYSGIATFNANDVLSLHIRSTDSTVTIEYSSVIVEQTKY